MNLGYDNRVLVWTLFPYLPTISQLIAYYKLQSLDIEMISYVKPPGRVKREA